MKKILHSKILGFSLIEALVASVVVAVAMMGLANLQGITLINSADSRMKTHALNLAQDKIEELRGFANQNTYTGLAGNTDTPTGANATFTRTWTVTDCSVSGNCTAQGNYKQANTTVTWTDRQGATQTVQLTSYIAEADPVKSGVVLLAATSSSSTSSSSTSSSTTSSTTGSTSSTSSSTGSTSSTGSSSTGSSTSSTSGGGGGDVSCDCRFQNNQQGYSLTGTNPSECTVSCCQDNDTGSGNNRYFSASCPVE